AVTTVLIWQEKRRTEQEKEQTREALARAEAKTRWARRAVDDMYTGVAEEWLTDTPNMTDVQRRFLRKALEFYEELVKEQATDPEVRHQTAMAYRRMGTICAELGEDQDKAEGYLRRAETLAGELADEFPDGESYREEQFRSAYQVGKYLSDYARSEEA